MSYCVSTITWINNGTTQVCVHAVFLRFGQRGAGSAYFASINVERKSSRYGSLTGVRRRRRHWFADVVQASTEL